MKNSFSVLVVFALALSFVLVGCDKKEEDERPTVVKEQEQLEHSQKELSKAVPVPQVKNSLVRKACARRLEELDKVDAISYVYIMSDSGKVIAYYSIRGVVVSLNTYMTAMEQVVEIPKHQVMGSTITNAIAGTELITREAPDTDGTYGKNPDGIFFWTTEGVRIETTNKYVWTSQPMKLTQQPELIQVIDSDKNPGAEAPSKK